MPKYTDQEKFEIFLLCKGVVEGDNCNERYLSPKMDLLIDWFEKKLLKPKRESPTIDTGSEEWNELIKEWTDYKKTERKETYKSEKTLASFYNLLKKYSNGNIHIAKEIIELSKSNKYAGIVKPKTQNNYVKRDYDKELSEFVNRG